MRRYPFSAIVEQEPMKLALLLNAVDPQVGGVLVRGHKGTGKSTAARGLAALLPEIDVVAGCPYNSDPRSPVAGWNSTETPTGSPVTLRRPMPFVELPLNATEDRLVGTLHIEKALQTGRRHFEPGLLAAAHRGVLYVDEVNLLDDHLVDMLLDAAASGVNTVEREGISFSHPSRFLLIGTMNPEEGELRPQFLDRFGLCAVAGSIPSLSSRETIIRRHLAFERDPDGFCRQWAEEDRLFGDQVSRARGHVEQTSISDDMIALAARLAQGLRVQGHRADITMLKAARAHAALLEKPGIDLDDLREAALLALPHRLVSSPLDSPKDQADQISRALGSITRGGGAEEQLPEEVRAEEDVDEMAEKIQIPGSAAAGSILFSFLKKKLTGQSSTPTSA